MQAESISAEAVREQRPWTATVLIAISLALLAVLTVEVALRVVFPWDLVMWSESPFLTNMLKLTNGTPLYTAPDDVNSYLYAPGLELLKNRLESFAGKPFLIDRHGVQAAHQPGQPMVAKQRLASVVAAQLDAVFSRRLVSGDGTRASSVSLRPARRLLELFCVVLRRRL